MLIKVVIPGIVVLELFLVYITSLYMGIGQIRRHIGMPIWLETINGI